MYLHVDTQMAMFMREGGYVGGDMGLAAWRKPHVRTPRTVVGGSTTSAMVTEYTMTE